MTTPELQRGAKAMFEHRNPWWYWDDLSQEGKDKLCQSFAAGILAMLPVGEGVIEVMRQAEPDDDLQTISSRLDSQAEHAFTAAIRHIAGRSE